jgi:glycosyltransferase involved in cell wall biosynthesis
MHNSGDRPERPLKILFVNASSGLAGAERSLLETAVPLKARGVTPVVALPGDGALAAELRDHGIETRFLNLGVMASRQELRSPLLLLRLLQQPVAAIRLAIIIRKERIDIVHSNTSAVAAGALGAFLARRPHVWHIREMLPEHGLLGAVMRWLIGHFSDRVICISVAVRYRFLKGSSRHARKAVIIANGIDVDAFASMASRADARPESELRIGMNSRVNPWKGQDTFVEAASIVRRRFPNSRFWIAGGCLSAYEPLKRRIAARAEDLGLDGHLTWAGQLPYEALARLLATYDVLVLPSSEPEPFGRVMLEAMACGKPVVATAHGGPLDVVVDGVTGLLVPPDNPPAMAAAVETLLSSEEMRRRMGTAGAERVREHFSLEREVDRLMSLYRDVGGKRLR